MVRRSMKRRGGGYGVGPLFVSAGNPVIQPNTQAGGPDCLAASRPGFLPLSSGKGLPGMSGGRYGMSLSQSVLDPARGIVGMPAQAVRIPCETGAPNSLNLRGGRRRRGGAFPVIDVGKAADMMAYHTPTGGYGNQMASAGGVPLMLQVPYAAKSCMSGGTRRRRKNKNKSRRHKKGHKKSHRRRP